MIKVIVFDFDDTLVISEEYKKIGYQQIFKDVPGSRKVIIEYIENNPAQKRFIAIRGIIDELKKRKIFTDADNKNIEWYINMYTNLVDKMVIGSEENKGADELLQDLSIKYSLCINTRTPHESILKIIKAKKWQKYFRYVYGSPPGSKIEHLKDIIIKSNVFADQVVVVGDGRCDLECALECKTKFVAFRGKYSNWSNSEDFVVIDKLKELKKVILQLNG